MEKINIFLMIGDPICHQENIIVVQLTINDLFCTYSRGAMHNLVAPCGENLGCPYTLSYLISIHTNSLSYISDPLWVFCDLLFIK